MSWKYVHKAWKNKESCVKLSSKYHDTQELFVKFVYSNFIANLDIWQKFNELFQYWIEIMQMYLSLHCIEY